MEETIGGKTVIGTRTLLMAINETAVFPLTIPAGPTMRVSLTIKATDEKGSRTDYSIADDKVNITIFGIERSKPGGGQPRVALGRTFTGAPFSFAASFHFGMDALVELHVQFYLG